MTDTSHRSDRLRVALDLSPLVEDRLSPAAMRVLEVIDGLSAAAERVAIMGIAPRADLGELPSAFQRIHSAAPLSGWQAMRYSHIDLPRLARRSGAQALLLAGSFPPLTSAVVCVALDEAVVVHSRRGWGRLREAAGRAGLQRARPVAYRRQARLGGGPAVAGQGEPVRRPEYDSTQGAPGKEVVLAHGVTPANLELLLSAWTWVTAACDAQLVVLTSHPLLRRRVEQRASAMGVGDSTIVPGDLAVAAVPGLYRDARMLLLGGGASEASPARWAMACGLPVAGVDGPALAALVGDAGFLVPSGDARALGAACLSLLTEGALAEDLAERARIRHRVLSDEPGRVDLAEALRRLVAERYRARP